MIAFEWGVAIGIGASVLSTLASVVAVWIGYKATVMARDGLQLAATGITLQRQEVRRNSIQPFLDAASGFNDVVGGTRVPARVRAGVGADEPDSETQQAFVRLWTQRKLLSAAMALDSDESSLTQAVNRCALGLEMTAKIILDRSNREDPGWLLASPIDYVLALVAERCRLHDPLGRVGVDAWVESLRTDLIEMDERGMRNWTMWTPQPPSWQILDVALNLLSPIATDVMDAMAAFVKEPVVLEGSPAA